MPIFNLTKHRMPLLAASCVPLAAIAKWSIVQKYKVRFFFEYGAGGCLWADNELTFTEFGVGPIDKDIATKTQTLSPETLGLIRTLDEEHSKYLNEDYPLYPSLWRQSECDNFNQSISTLLERLRNEMGDDFEIIDKQPRYSEDPDLDAYLKNFSQFRR